MNRGLLLKRLDCTVFGDTLIDVIICDRPDVVTRGGTTYVDEAKIEFGGSGNVAAGLSALGGNVAFVGKAGEDSIGQSYIEDLKRSNVIPRVFLDKVYPTGFTVTLTHEMKERSFLVFRGANDRLSVNEIERVEELIRDSRFVYFSGFSLVNDPQKSATLRAVRLARRLEAKVVFDPGAHNLVRSQRGIFDELLSLCDVFSPNLDEAMALTSTTGLSEVINELRNLVPLTALKCHGEGSVLITEDITLKSPSPKVRCLDPTGAGDAFTAALIYGLSSDLPLQSIGRLSNWFAAQVISNIGPRSFPRKSEINDFVKKLM